MDRCGGSASGHCRSVTPTPTRLPGSLACALTQSHIHPVKPSHAELKKHVQQPLIPGAQPMNTPTNIMHAHLGLELHAQLIEHLNHSPGDGDGEDGVGARGAARGVVGLVKREVCSSSTSQQEQLHFPRLCGNKKCIKSNWVVEYMQSLQASMHN